MHVYINELIEQAHIAYDLCDTEILRKLTISASCVYIRTFSFDSYARQMFLCQLTCQSADIMSSLCGMGVRVNNFSSKTTRPRDMLFF